MRMGEGAIPIAFEEADAAIHISGGHIYIAVAIKVCRHQREQLASAPAALRVGLQ